MLSPISPCVLPSPIPLSSPHPPSRETRFYLDPRTPLEEVRKELRSQCALKAETPFNLKWLDVDGDPISVDCPREWDEAIRLYIYNQDTELLLHGGWAGPSSTQWVGGRGRAAHSGWVGGAEQHTAGGWAGPSSTQRVGGRGRAAHSGWVGGAEQHTAGGWAGPSSTQRVGGRGRAAHGGWVGGAEQHTAGGWVGPSSTQWVGRRGRAAHSGCAFLVSLLQSISLTCSVVCSV